MHRRRKYVTIGSRKDIESFIDTVVYDASARIAAASAAHASALYSSADLKYLGLYISLGQDF